MLFTAFLVLTVLFVPIETWTSKGRAQTQAKGGTSFWLLLIIRLSAVDSVTYAARVCLQKAPAKPKKAKEVEKAKPEEKAPEAPAENGEAKAEEEVKLMRFHHK